MVIVAAIAAAILAATPSAPGAAPGPAVAPDRQAQAVVRILPAAAVRFAELEQDRPEIFRESRIRSADGTVSAAKLVEFE